MRQRFCSNRTAHFLFAIVALSAAFLFAHPARAAVFLSQTTNSSTAQSLGGGYGFHLGQPSASATMATDEYFAIELDSFSSCDLYANFRQFEDSGYTNQDFGGAPDAQASDVFLTPYVVATSSWNGSGNNEIIILDLEGWHADLDASKYYQMDLGCSSGSGSVYESAGGTLYYAFGASTSSVLAALGGAAVPAVNLSSFGQYESDGSTAIADGAIITSSTVVFKGVPMSSSSDELSFQVEVEPGGIEFTNAATASSSLVYSGSTASTTASGLPNGLYHWQGQAIDPTTDAASGWELFATSTNNNDFFVQTPPLVLLEQTSSFYSQTLNDGYGFHLGQAIGTDNTDPLYLAARQTSDNLCTSGNLYINFRQFDNSGYTTGNTLIAHGGIVYQTYPLVVFEINSFSAPILYGKYYQFDVGCSSGGTMDLATSLSNQLNFALGDTAAAVETALNFNISSMNQYESDGTTTIPLGATTTETAINFGATVNSNATSDLQLQVEVEPGGSNDFIGAPNVTSATSVAPGSETILMYGTEDPVYGLYPESSSNGDYHWQARTFDGTNYSSWQSFTSDATSTTFAINTVPLYTQEESDYPDSSDTAWWANSAYDDAITGTGCGQSTSTIAACGCAITSVSMWLRYYGISTDTLGNPVNPGNLNAWLEATSSGGYDSEGDLEWGAIENYASTTDGGSVVFASSSFDYDHEPVSELESYINPLINSSTPDPVILVEDHAPDGTTTTEHWLVAIGSSTYDGTSTYAIRDSYWYNTQYLNQPTSTGPGTVNFYNNNIDGIRIYYDPPKAPLFNEYHINLPNSLMLVDSEGKRAGKDPSTGIIYREIPNASYGEDGKSGELFFSSPPDGKYTLYILGGETGEYHLDSWIDNGEKQSPPQRVSGNIQNGSMVKYLQNYSTTNISGSDLLLGGIVSSTASVTTILPDNLPLPSPATSLGPPPHNTSLFVGPYSPIATSTEVTTTTLILQTSPTSSSENTAANLSTIISSSTP